MTETKRDIEVALGMFIALQHLKEMRTENKTSVGVLQDLSGIDDEHAAMLYEVAENHTTLHLQAVETVTGKGHGDKLSEDEINHAIMQAFVMAALTEGNLASEHKTFVDLKITDIDVDHNNIRKATNGLDPQMVAMVADIVCEESFPNAKPIREVLVALWIEGFIVGLIGPELLEANHDDPRVQHSLRVAESLFGVEMD